MKAFFLSSLLAAASSSPVIQQVAHLPHPVAHHGLVAHPVAHAVHHPVAHAVHHPVPHAVHHPVPHAVHHPVAHAVHHAAPAYGPVAPVVHHAPAPAYHAAPVPPPAPVVHAAPAYHPVVKEAPEPYTYTYGVADDYSKANFNAAETADANGVVSGSYSVALPDGRIQHVKYTADHVNGYVAEVTYEGTPVYPEAKPYAPAPAPYHA